MLSRGRDDGFYPNRIAKKSEPATVVSYDGLGIRRVSEAPATTTSKSAIIWNAYDAHPQVGLSGSFMAKEADQEPLAGTALRAFDFDMAISDCFFTAMT
jgi:hypothetical protein